MANRRAVWMSERIAPALVREIQQKHHSTNSTHYLPGIPTCRETTTCPQAGRVPPGPKADSFIYTVDEENQDGSTAMHMLQQAPTDLLDTDPSEIIIPKDKIVVLSSPTSSAINSLVNWRMRLDSDLHDPEMSPLFDLTPIQSTQASPIASFPTSNQPVLDTTMKEMLISLHSSLHNI